MVLLGDLKLVLRDAEQAGDLSARVVRVPRLDRVYTSHQNISAAATRVHP